MLIETAKVLNIKNESVFLEVQKSGHCSSCSASSTCGNSLLSKLHSEKSRRLSLNNDKFCGKIGDIVNIGIEESELLRLSFSFYLFPLMIMIVSVLIFDFFEFAELWLIFIALSSLAVGFLGLGIITWNYKKCIKLL